MSRYILNNFFRGYTWNKLNIQINSIFITTFIQYNKKYKNKRLLWSEMEN